MKDMLYVRNANAIVSGLPSELYKQKLKWGDRMHLRLFNRIRSNILLRDLANVRFLWALAASRDEEWEPAAGDIEGFADAYPDLPGTEIEERSRCLFRKSNSAVTLLGDAGRGCYNGRIIAEGIDMMAFIFPPSENHIVVMLNEKVIVLEEGGDKVPMYFPMHLPFLSALSALGGENFWGVNRVDIYIDEGGITCKCPEPPISGNGGFA